MSEYSKEIDIPSYPPPPYAPANPSSQAFQAEPPAYNHTPPTTSTVVSVSATRPSANGDIWKLFHWYLISALSNEIQVVTESQTPVWNVSKTYGREYGIEIKAPVPCQSQSVYTSSSDTAGSCSPPLPGSVLAAARFKPCSNAIDLCIGDPKQSTGNSAINSWSESMTRKCAWLHDRYRWSMDAAKLTVPVGIQISHPRITSARRMSFKWRRPDDSVWKSGWELYLVDDEGDSYGAGRSVCRGKFPMGKARVLARWTDNESELTDKGRLQMMDGWGENWELMVAVTLFAVEEKTRKRR